jgi:histone-arginine methyltransferase CARM1
MVANPMRSYDISAEIVTGNQLLSSPTSQPIDSRTVQEGFTRRTGKWALHEQTYYFDQPLDNLVNKPEYCGLYQAESQGSV